MAKKIKLGKLYQDTLTGYEGVATARHEYMYGCVRITVERKDKDGKIETEIFDEQRMEQADGKKPRLTATAGGPQPAFPDRSVPPGR